MKSTRAARLDFSARVRTWLCRTIVFYDGVFGPGAGSHYTLAFLALVGRNLITATANAKILN